VKASMCSRIIPGASQASRGSVRLKTKEGYHRLYVETESSSFDRTCLMMNRQAGRQTDRQTLSNSWNKSSVFRPSV